MFENLGKIFPNRPKMVPNSRKIDLWSCPGALWAPSWRQDGPRATPRAKFDEKCSILGWPMGSKMEPKSIKKSDVKIDFIFVTISRALFLDLGLILVPKT